MGHVRGDKLGSPGPAESPLTPLTKARREAALGLLARGIGTDYTTAVAGFRKDSPDVSDVVVRLALNDLRSLGLVNVE